MISLTGNVETFSAKAPRKDGQAMRIDLCLCIELRKAFITQTHCRLFWRNDQLAQGRQVAENIVSK